MDRVDALALSFDRAASVLDNIRPDQLGDPTPCVEWDLRTLVGHLTAVVENCGRGIRGEAMDPAFNTPLADDLGAQFREVAVATLAAWRACDLDGMVDIGAGPMPAQIALGINLVDTTTHTWDVARATGQEVTFPEEHAALVLDAGQGFITDERRGVVGFDPPVPVGADAGGTDRLVAFLGRNP